MIGNQQRAVKQRETEYKKKEKQKNANSQYV